MKKLKAAMPLLIATFIITPKAYALSQASRTEVCRVDTVSGEKAMRTFPGGIDIFFGRTTEYEGRGFLALRYTREPGPADRFAHDRLELLETKVDSSQVGSADKYRFTSIDQATSFTEDKFDWNTYETIWTLRINDEQGTYRCQYAGPSQLPH